MSRDLQNLCERLDDVFHAGTDEPDELCQEALAAIEELWEERDLLRVTLTHIAKDTSSSAHGLSALAQAILEQPAESGADHAKD